MGGSLGSSWMVGPHPASQGPWRRACSSWQWGAQPLRSVPDWVPPLSPLGVARGQNSDTRKGGAWDRAFPSRPSLQTTLGATLPDVALELEVRPCDAPL